MPTKVIRYGDLFCGMGAFHTAFDRWNAAHAGDDRYPQYECAVAVDIDEGARRLYEENYGVSPLGDIYGVDDADLPDFDLLCAGFPCQPFSLAGKRDGFAAEKGGLFFRLMDLVDAKKPATIVLENVPNILAINGGATFRRILGELEQRGYLVNHRVLNAAHFGSPQRRKRLYIVADRDRRFVFPEPDRSRPPVPVRSILDTTDHPWCRYSHKYRLVASKSNRGGERYRLINRTTGKGGWQGYRVYDLDQPGPTICAFSGGLGARTGLYDFGGGRIRTLSPLEGLRMFGFPDDYRRRSLARHPRRLLNYLGNSIVVRVLDALIPRLHRPVEPGVLAA